MQTGMAPSKLGDAALVALTVDGDDAAFTELVARHAPAMSRYATYLTSSQTDADEAVQEALITAWQTIETLRNRDAVRSWLMRITARKAIDQMRARRPSQPIEDLQIAGSFPTPQEEVAQSQTLEQLQRVLREIPSNQRQVWVLREIGQMNYEEIARDCGISEATVRGRLARARKNIAQKMGEWR
ncbi:MAG: RNA polymerase sigma factor [Actinomycetaceae bacterium]|nr:RNA polymerase sigma factor [Actinomycetaceae bacterium]